MAILSKTGITTGQTVEPGHVTQSIDAFTGIEAYDIFLSGSFNMTGSINGQPGVVNNLTASRAISSSFATTSSYALNAGASFPYSGSAVITGSLTVTGSCIVDGGFVARDTSNRFAIRVSGTTSRLLFDSTETTSFDFENRKLAGPDGTEAITFNTKSVVTINDVLYLPPRTTTPSSPQVGMIIVSGSMLGPWKPFFYDGLSWRSMI